MMAWLLSPNAILAAAIVAAGIWLWDANRRTYDKGVVAGKGSASVAAVESATKTAEAEREAEAETPHDADREYFRQFCATQASCRAREKYRAAYGGKR